MSEDSFLLEFGDLILTVNRLRLHRGQIGIIAVNQASSVGSASLKACSAMEHDHYVLAQRARCILLTSAQASPRRDHEHDGDNPPGDSKHCQECPEFMRPQGSNHVDNQISQGHCASS